MCDPEDEDFEVNASQLTRRMKHLAGVLTHFWKRWRSEYLSELREAHSYSAKKTLCRPHVSVGDVVVVHDDTLPRGLWKLGRIQKLFIGPDEVPRGALVRVATRDRQHVLLKRPLQLLYPLEIQEAEPTSEPAVHTSTPPPPPPLKRKNLPFPSQKSILFVQRPKGPMKGERCGSTTYRTKPKFWITQLTMSGQRGADVGN